MPSIERSLSPTSPTDTITTTTLPVPIPNLGSSSHDPYPCPFSPTSSVTDSEHDFPINSFRRFSTTSPAGHSLPKDLASAKIEGLPDTAYYLPGFISKAEEKRILDKVRSPVALALLRIQREGGNNA